jgi:hypothetical protein
VLFSRLPSTSPPRVKSPPRVAYPGKFSPFSLRRASRRARSIILTRGLLLFSLIAGVPGIARAADCTGDCVRFPPDSGIVNVHDFGARGDGHTDDTNALLAAIDAAGPDTGAFFWRTKIVFLPAGTYRVSRTLGRHYANGKFGSGMILIGASAATTIIQLADHAPEFGDPAAPRGVVMTTAKLLDGTPTSGGKDYTHKGEGNDAYENFLEHLTIDVGHGNPGAIGIDYLANNLGAIRDVRVTAPADSGATGIAMTRKWPGPLLLQRDTIHGFATGVAVGDTEYGVTIDHVRLEEQREVGLRNDGNSVAAAHLTVAGSVNPIANTAPGGLIVLADSELRHAAGESDPPAFDNHGMIVARRLAFDGYAPPAGITGSGPVTGALTGAAWRSLPAGDEVELADAPAPPPDPASDWVNVLRYATPTLAAPGHATPGHATPAHATPGPESRDITDALRQAFASGASTVYLPFGRYLIHAAIQVPASVRRIVGMNASLTVRPEREPDFARTSGMLRITQPGPPLTIERLAFDMTDLGDQLAVEVAAPRDVVLRDIVTAGTSLLDRLPGGGRVFIEDVCCGALHLAGPKPVIARQLDTEGDDVRIANDGGNLAVLGIKTEGDGVVVDNRDGAHTTILGGLLYIVHDANPAVPAFRAAGTGLGAAFVEESLQPASHYTTYLEQPGGAVRAAEFPARGDGRIVPWLVSGAAAGR